MSDSHELLKPLLDELHKSGRLRVWSIVISIFGDLVQPRGGRISMQELLALTENVGIEGNALRTAMSRLAKEEWVDRYKEGRNSFYTLSGNGKQTFLAASERIYQARFNSGSSEWVMAFYPEDLPQQTVDVASRLSFNKRIAVCSIEDKARLENGQALILDARVGDIPAWAREELIPQNLTEQYGILLKHLQTIDSRSDEIVSLPPLSAITLRYLLIHFWRRLVLKHPLLPDGLVTKDWEGISVHKLMCKLYPLTISASEAWWETPTSESGKQLLEKRFKD
ncbi:MAG: PaaX family transcriptional regulator C-terminal domain-containing protein [Pseudomonadota bacterium]